MELHIASQTKKVALLRTVQCELSKLNSKIAEYLAVLCDVIEGNMELTNVLLSPTDALKLRRIQFSTRKQTPHGHLFRSVSLPVASRTVPPMQHRIEESDVSGSEVKLNLEEFMCELDNSLAGSEYKEEEEEEDSGELDEEREEEEEEEEEEDSDDETYLALGSRITDKHPLIPRQSDTDKFRNSTYNYQDATVGKYMKIDTMLLKGTVNADCLLMTTLSAAMREFPSNKITKLLIKVACQFISIPVFTYVGELEDSNALSNALYDLPERTKTPAAYVKIINLILKVPMRNGLLNSISISTHLRHAYVNRDTLGMSPALYVVLTVSSVDDLSLQRVINSYPKDELDIYYAVSHLTRGLDKYKCVFHGSYPSCSFLSQSSVVALGFLNVLKRNLTKSEFVVALLGVAVRFCDMEVVYPNGTTEEGEESVRLLLYKVRQHLKNAVKSRSVKEIVGKWSAVGRSCNTTLNAVCTHILLSRHLNRSMGRVISANHTGGRFYIGLCEILLRVSMVGFIRVETMYLLMKAYWSVMLYDDNNYKGALEKENMTLLLHVGGKVMAHYPNCTHLSNMLKVCEMMHIDQRVYKIFEKVNVALCATDLPLKDKISTLNKSMMRGYCNNYAFDGVYKMYKMCVARVRDSAIYDVEAIQVIPV